MVLSLNYNDIYDVILINNSVPKIDFYFVTRTVIAQE